MIGDYDVDPGVHPHDEVPIFKVCIRVLLRVSSTLARHMNLSFDRRIHCYN